MTTVRVMEDYPLSPLQQGMFIAELIGAGSGVDVEQVVCRSRLPLDAARMQSAWRSVMDRHACLRSSFHKDDVDEPLQRVHPAPPLPFKPLVIRDGDAGLAAFLAEDRSVRFDLDQAPVMRLALGDDGQGGCVMVWTFHHISLDGRSFEIVLREVFEAYEALVGGREVAFEPVTPFRDHIDVLDARRQATAHDKAFWHTRIGDVAAATALPGESSALTEIAAGGDDRAYGHLELGEAVAERLKHLAQATNISIETMVHSAWGLLLSRYADTRDVVFGQLRHCRDTGAAGAHTMVGNLMNTVPLRIVIDPERSVSELLAGVEAGQAGLGVHEHTSLAEIQSWSALSAGAKLFESLVIFETGSLNSRLAAVGCASADRRFELIEKTGFPLTLNAYDDATLRLRLSYDRRRFDSARIERVLVHLGQILTAIADDPGQQVSKLSMLTADERRAVTVGWNETAVDWPRAASIHTLIEAQAARTPDATAVTALGRSISYRDLDVRSNQLARYLRELGIGHDKLVGICLNRSIDMVVAMLGVLKAGGAYLPLDPTYPSDRIAYMAKDSGARVILSERALDGVAPFGDTSRVVLVDAERDQLAARDGSPLAIERRPEALAYVIYTSGSTGLPKGVMVEHRNVVNFFTGMDARIGEAAGRTWLAVTSISFDISVLELLYTLARGFHVVVYSVFRGKTVAPAAVTSSVAGPGRRGGRGGMSFGLFYFASDAGGAEADKYKLLLDGARFADAHGFSSVSVPERHFHAFGGLYPNPAVSAAAIAAITSNVQIRSGSVVLPLHHPIRVAEDWSVVDNLSKGRVGLAMASGWQPVDFVLRPEAYADRQRGLFNSIEIVRRLWRGERVAFPDASGISREIETLPRPISKELPVWITTSGSPQTWVEAGRRGFNVLTHLLGQTEADVAAKVALYRRARADAGHDPAAGQVTMMLHTFVGDDVDAVREIVREPMKAYLKSSLGLVRDFTQAWTAYKRRDDGSAVTPTGVDLETLSPEELDGLLEYAFLRYFETSGLFGTPRSCLELVHRLAAIGVDEIACLIDFGVPADVALSHLGKLDELRRLAQQEAALVPPGSDLSGPADPSGPDLSASEMIPTLIERHGVTHLQCTPSFAWLLLQDGETRAALGGLEKVMIGGEAFPIALARDMRAATPAHVLNMYGPTETTIWSSTQDVAGDERTISIGRPIANTQFYVLDDTLQPSPIGIPGRLFIGGAGVVRGYHDRPELTAERFLPNPFSGHTDERIYDTGDVARWRPDGLLDFLGRADNQVKVHGYRIELGEIEASLAKCPGVREAVAMVRSDNLGDAHIVAYYIPHAGTDIASDDLRRSLAETLPEYMLPSHFVAMSAFPVTPNNKVDRKALPPPSKPAPASHGVESDMAGNAAEARLAAIWQDVLGIATVRRTQNFFDLGGHSLLAVKMHRRINEAFGAGISIVDIFRYPTVAALAELIGGISQASAKLEGSERRGAARRQMAEQRRRARTDRIPDLV